MTNEKLGVLMVDVPEPRYGKYYYLECINETYTIFISNRKKTVELDAYKCTQEEAKKYPQFRWAALEELT